MRTNAAAGVAATHIGVAAQRGFGYSAAAMTPILLKILVLCLAVVSAAVTAAVNEACDSGVAAPPLVFTSVTTIDPGFGARQDQTVLLENGVISAIGDAPSVVVPEGAVVIDAQGKYFLPGLSDMHAHISGYAGEGGIEHRQDVIENNLLLFLTAGVTLIRDPSGQANYRTVKAAIECGETPGPHLVYTAPVIEGPDAVWPTSIKVGDPNAIEPLFREWRDAGFWGVKLYHSLEADVYYEAIRQAQRLGLASVGHVPFSVGIEGALSVGQQYIEHFRGYDFDGMSQAELIADGGRSARRFAVWQRMQPARVDQLIDMTVAAGSWNTPTLILNKYLFDAEGRSRQLAHPDMALIHPYTTASLEGAEALDELFSPAARAAMRASLPYQLEFLRRLHAAGGRLLIGTDTTLMAHVPGFGVLEEMMLFEEAGIPPEEVLEIATLSAAKSVGLGQRKGRLQVGMDADLVLLAENPLNSLDALKAVHGTVVGGKWYSAAELRKRLRAQADSWGGK